MARTTLEHQEDKLTFPVDSLLLLKVLEANTFMQKSRDGRSEWEKINIKFQIEQILAIGGATDPSVAAAYQNWVGEEIYASTKFYLSDKADNQLRNWLEAILGVQGSLPLNFEFDTNMLPGRTCKGVTSQYESRATDQNGVPYKRHQVQDLLPVGGMAMSNPQQPPPQQWAPQQVAGSWAPQQPPATQQQQDPWAPPAPAPPAQQNGYAQQAYRQQVQAQQQAQQPAPQAQQPLPAPAQQAPPADPWAGWDEAEF